MSGLKTGSLPSTRVNLDTHKTVPTSVPNPQAAEIPRVSPGPETEKATPRFSWADFNIFFTAHARRILELGSWPSVIFWTTITTLILAIIGMVIAIARTVQYDQVDADDHFEMQQFESIDDLPPWPVPEVAQP
jgi:hypothetical protein